MVLCDKAVMGKNNFLVQFEYGNRIDISYCLLSYVCSEEDFGQELNETIFNF